jgi:AraC-like DNA-binding protein
MFTDTDLIINIVNAACIGFLVLMLVILVAATRMKNGAGWAALIMTAAIVPASLSNLTRDIASEYFVWFMYPRVFFDLLWFPALWFFAKSQLDKSFRFSARYFWHLIPAFAILAYTISFYAPMTAEQVGAEMAAWAAGNENMPALFNDITGCTQFLCYFTAVFFYIRKRKKYLQENYSDSGISNIRWLTNFFIVHFVLFILAMIIYTMDPRDGSWVCPIATIFVMSYLLYVVVKYPTAHYISRLPDMTPANSPKERKYSTVLEEVEEDKMKEICDAVVQYLRTSLAYKNCNLSLATLSHETGIHHKTISTAINTHLKKNFFKIVNGMRVEEAKRQLQNINTNYVIESIAIDCGFRSRTTFFTTFKKMEGTTPKQWLKKHVNSESNKN